MQRWEYVFFTWERVTDMHGKTRDPEAYQNGEQILWGSSGDTGIYLNILGEQGWEVVGWTSEQLIYPGNGIVNRRTAILKRPKA